MTTPPALQSLIQSRIRQDVQSMHAYEVQDATGMVKLDAMENPHRLPADLQRRLGERLGALELNRYPGTRGDDLRAALAKHARMPEGFALMVGNGSDELISLLALGCDVPGASILAPAPGFVMYQVSAQLQGMPFHGVPLSADFELDEAAMLAAIEKHKPSIVYLAYPNNPTANPWNDATIEKIVEKQGAAGGMVVFDEGHLLEYSAQRALTYEVQNSTLLNLLERIMVNDIREPTLRLMEYLIETHDTFAPALRGADF